MTDVWLIFYIHLQLHRELKVHLLSVAGCLLQRDCCRHTSLPEMKRPLLWPESCYSCSRSFLLTLLLISLRLSWELNWVQSLSPPCFAGLIASPIFSSRGSIIILFSSAPKYNCWAWQGRCGGRPNTVRIQRSNRWGSRGLQADETGDSSSDVILSFIKLILQHI